MPDGARIGPFSFVEVGYAQAPWYVLPFDRDGNSEAPRTVEHFISSLSASECTDIYLFSHGWNNAWPDAIRSYEHFIAGYIKATLEHPFDRPHVPVLVGIYWPSAILRMPWEHGPRFAGEAPQDERAQAELDMFEVAELGAMIPSEDRARFYELAQADQLDQNEARELAGLLERAYSLETEELPRATTPPTANELIAMWSSMPAVAGPRDSDDFGTLSDDRSQPAAAGIGFLDPRAILRAATVWMMKDRAGRVGSRGVASLLVQLLTNSAARTHLVGHSFGAKLLLSSMTTRDLPRPVNSVLLLQPAINHRCFAADATGDGRPGGYRSALARVEQPILSTFSGRDSPLTQFFHLALRREKDLGEQAAAGAPPSKYAALGGYGPAGCDDQCQEVPMKAVGDDYEPTPPHIKLFGLESTGHISGHSDVSNPATWWALRSQVGSLGT